ncbi:MAG: cysteine synthase family protein [Caldilineae bacterium]|nr:MAG: cysteine synthase family protein [Caldilineae bacterium]
MATKAQILTVDPDRWRHPPRPPILRQIGNTPLLKLEHVTAGLRPGVEVYAKAEWFNPGGSVKDRPALRMIEQAELRGELTPGKAIIDATSGNTGIGYALVGAAKGYRVVLVMPENVTSERKQLARAYGAELIFSDPLEGQDGAIRLVREMVAAHPERYYYPNQYDNDDNWKAHYYGTANEIWHQTRGRITHFVAAIGTSGTFMGISRRLRELNPNVRLITVEPADELQNIEGMKHMATAIVPKIYDPAQKDGEVLVHAEQAHDMARRLVREEGLFVGLSAGAAVHAALQVARRLDHGLVVTVLPDSGAKYVSLGIFD